VRLDETAHVGLAGMLALVATYGIGRQAYGLFVPILGDEFGLSLDVLGFYASAAQAGYLIATVATGVLTARFGPRLPVVAGCLLLAVGAAMIAWAPGPILLAVGIVAAGTSADGRPTARSAGSCCAPPSRVATRALEPPIGRNLVAMKRGHNLRRRVVCTGVFYRSSDGRSGRVGHRQPVVPAMGVRGKPGSRS